MKGLDLRDAFPGCRIVGINADRSIGKLSVITDDAFAGRSNFKTFRVKDGVYRIGKRAFRNCANLTEVTIPEGVEEIDDEAFAGCPDLEKIALPQSVRYLGERVFYRC